MKKKKTNSANIKRILLRESHIAHILKLLKKRINNFLLNKIKNKFATTNKKKERILSYLIVLTFSTLLNVQKEKDYRLIFML